MPITLPLDPIPATRVNPRLMLLYGKEKIGKSTLMAQLNQPGMTKKTLMVDIQKKSGYAFLGNGIYVHVPDAQTFYDLGESIKKAGRPYGRIVLDPVSSLMTEWAERKAMGMYKSSPVGVNFTGTSVLALPNGGGYYWLRKAFDSFIDEAMTWADEVVVVCHVKDKYAGVEETVNVASGEIDLLGKLKPMMCQEADVIGHMFRNPQDGYKMWVSFQSPERVTCGCRCGHLINKSFEFKWGRIYKGEGYEGDEAEKTGTNNVVSSATTGTPTA